MFARKTINVVLFCMFCLNVAFANDLNIAFAAINSPKDIKSDVTEGASKDNLVKTRYKNIKVKDFNIGATNSEDIIESLDEISELLYDSLTNAGPALSTKEKQKAKFSDLLYKDDSLVPENIKALHAFHKDRKKYGIKFLTQLSYEQDAHIIIYEKIQSRKWRNFGTRMYNKNNLHKAGRGKIKPAIAVFNNFSKAQTYTYPTITAENIVQEEYEQIQSIIEDKAIDALKKAFNAGVATPAKKASSTSISTKEEAPQDFSKSATGGF